MSLSKPPRPRLFCAVWFFAAVGVLAGGLLLEALGWSEAMGFEAGLGRTLAYIGCAFMVGRGIGELRGMKYAEGLLNEAKSAP